MVKSGIANIQSKKGTTFISANTGASKKGNLGEEFCDWMQIIKMKALLALLVVLGLSSCVFAGGYGGGAGYQTYAAYRPAAVGISGGGGEIIIYLCYPFHLTRCLCTSACCLPGIQ
uniref:Uncharacterized protein n=1 Tax=Magallana gigas TaxID=29159 RepID=A0A8W8HXX0_MAGGI